MSRHWKRIVTLLCLLAGFAPSVQAQSPAQNLSGSTVSDARQALRKSLLAMVGREVEFEIYDVWDLSPLQDLVIRSDGFQFTEEGTTHRKGALCLLCAWSQGAGPAYKITREFKLDEMDYVSIRKYKQQFGVVRAGTKEWIGKRITAWKDIGDAQRFVDAINVLIFEYGGGDPEKEAADFEEFKARARSWRDLSIKPQLSDEALRENVLAEEAIRQKDLEAVISHYQAALKWTPLWPQGHFNVAMVDGEFGDYFDAVRHMRRFLELVPEDADAKVARNKVIVWEDKAHQRRQRAAVPARK